MIEVLTVQSNQKVNGDQELSKPQRIKNQRNVIDKKLKSIDYVLKIQQEGFELFNQRNPDRMVKPETFFEFVSLEQIPEYIGMMQRSFWTHESLTDDMSNQDLMKIPFKEKKWGIYKNIEILTLEEFDRKHPVRIGNPRSN